MHLFNLKQESDGEKSDQELVVDVANEEAPSNGTSGSPRTLNNGLAMGGPANNNGNNGNGQSQLDKIVKKEHPGAHSPHSSISSNSSTPSSKHKDVSIPGDRTSRSSSSWTCSANRY